ncbi:MAG: hypothetical protein QW555_02530 [Nitrososphaerota archaeon]
MPVWGGGEKAEVTRIARAISSPIRLSIIEALNTSQMNFSELIKYLGLKDSKNVGKFTYHIKTLLRAGLVAYSNKTRLYSLTPLGKNVVEVLTRFTGVSHGGGIVAQRFDYSMEVVNRNSVAEFISEALQLPPDLARRVGILVEKRLEELRETPIQRWLIDDLTRLELVNSQVSIEKLSNISPTTPSLYELFKAFQRSVDSNDIASFNRYVHHTVMNRLVVERLFPRQIRNQYFMGEIDILYPSWSITHVYSLSLDITDLSQSIKLAGMVFNDLVATSHSSQEAPHIPYSSFGLPQVVYRVIEAQPRKIVEGSSTFKGDARFQRFLSFCGLADVVRVGLPSSLSQPFLCTLCQDSKVKMTQYAVQMVSQEGFAIHAFIGINLMRLVTLNGFNESSLLARATETFESLAKYLHRSTQYLQRIQRIGSKTRLYYLLAPVGLVEALKLFLEPRSMEDKYRSMCKVLNILSKAADNVVSLRGKAILASKWPRSLSERMHSIDELMLPRRFEGTNTSIQLSEYANNLAEMLISLDTEQLREIVRLMGQLIIDDETVEIMVKQQGMEPFQDMLASLPILLHVSPQQRATAS